MNLKKLAIVTDSIDGRNEFLDKLDVLLDSDEDIIDEVISLNGRISQKEVSALVAQYNNHYAEEEIPEFFMTGQAVSPNKVHIKVIPAGMRNSVISHENLWDLGWRPNGFSDGYRHYKFESHFPEKVDKAVDTLKEKYPDIPFEFLPQTDRGGGRWFVLEQVVKIPNKYYSLDPIK